VPSYINKLDTTLIYFFGVSILMYKQIPLVITASILLTAFLTIALYTGSEAHAQAGGGNMTKSGNATAAGGANMTKSGNATAAGGANMTKSGNATAAGGANMTSSNATAAGGANMTSSNATAAGGANMTQPLVPPKLPSS
jgi:hypothetical protein